MSARPAPAEHRLMLEVLAQFRLRGLHTDLGRLIKAMRVKSLSAAHTALISEMK